MQTSEIRQTGLSNFGLRDMIECGRAIRALARDAGSMQEAARLLVNYFRGALADNTLSGPDCVLVRCFKTHPLQRLPAESQEKARGLLHKPRSTDGDLPCLTLLATAGDLPAWNSRFESAGHAAIPLESVEVVERAPMIAQLISQMGLTIASVLAPTEELLLHSENEVYGVFHVPVALGSSFIPAQDFVQKFEIKSVLGFGGLLPSGEFFAMILFSRVPISRETAGLFRTLALSVKLVLLPFTRGPIFADDMPNVDLTDLRRSFEQESLRSEIATLKLLLPALEDAAMYQTDRLEDSVSKLTLRAKEIEDMGTRLYQMLESTSDAVFMLDCDWRFTYLNGHAIALLGGERDLLGKNIWEEFPASGERSFWHRYHEVKRDGIPASFEEHFPTPVDRWFEVQAFPSDQGIAVFFHDVTTKRKVNAALMRSEKLAAVGRLAASIAHEINNPLESVTNLIFLASSTTDVPEIKGYLSQADQEIRRVGGITAQTLRFYKQSTKPAETTCFDLMSSALSIFQARFINSNVVVEKRKRADQKIICYEGEIRQVLSNLIGNAIDAMHPLGGKLILRSRDGTDWRTNRRGVFLTVADTGHGMPASVAARAKEAFFTTKDIGGTGLGLWISQEIVDRHKGRFMFRSRSGKSRNGTVFTIFLPADPAERQ